MTGTSPADLSAQSWEGRYQEGTDRWDLGQPAPPFVRLLNAGVPPGRLVSLGMGRGHDALLFAARGFTVVGVDFAPSAIAAATAAASQQQLNAQFWQRDMFDLLPEYAGQFDYVLEHTCFCAIEPVLRSRYVQLVKGLLHPGGELIALFWAHPRPGGPPFGATPQEILDLFSPDFEVCSFDRAEDSIASRQGEEYLARFRRR